MSGETLGYATVQIIPSLRGAEAAIDRQLAGMNLGGLGNKAGASLGHGLSSSIAAGVSTAALSLGAAATAAGTYGLKLASANEMAEISFTTMLGSAQDAGAFLDDLRDFAATTPFEFPELQTASSSLISAGVEASKVIPIMTTLGDVTAGMGTGSDGIKRATIALQQMQAAGKITGEDLNQLRDAGVPVYDLLAAATGKAKTEVVALAQAGQLGKTELDQLMGALESGKGLERFSGLMDAQSASLSGMLSTLKDVVGQDLATAMEPGVAELKEMLPPITDSAHALVGELAPAFSTAFGLAGRVLPQVLDALDFGLDALHDYGPALAAVTGGFSAMGAGSLPILRDFLPAVNPVVAGVVALALATPEARDALADVAKELGPLGAELLTSLLPILGDLGDMAGDVLPGAIKITGTALEAAFAVAVPLADGFASLTGFMADNEIVTQALAGAAAGYAVSAGLAAIGSASWSSSSIVAAATSVALTVAAAAETVAVEGLAASLGTLAAVQVSSAAMAGGAVAGLVVGYAAASASLDRSADHGIAAADRFIDGLTIEPTSIRSMAAGVAELSEQYDALASDAERAGSGMTASAAQFKQRLNPFDENTIDEAVAGRERLSEQIAAWAVDTLKLSEIGRTLDLSGDGVERLFSRLKINPADYDTSEIVQMGDDLLAAARVGTPATDTMAASLTTLSDATSSSTDKIAAWRDQLDAAMGVQSGIFDATTDLRGSLRDLTATFAVNGSDIMSNTEAADDNRSALSAARDAAIAYVGAYAENGDMETASIILAQQRQALVDAGEAAGVSKTQMDDYLDSLGLTEDLVTTQLDSSKVTTAKDQADKLLAGLHELDGATYGAKVKLTVDDGGLSGIITALTPGAGGSILQQLGAAISGGAGAGSIVGGQHAPSEGNNRMAPTFDPVNLASPAGPGRSERQPRRRHRGQVRDVHFHHHGSSTATVVRDALWELD